MPDYPVKDGNGNTIVSVANSGRFSGVTAPAKAPVPVTKADADLPGGNCRALLVGTAGTLNIMDITGTIRTAVPVNVGENNLACVQVRTGGTASDIWALY